MAKFKCVHTGCIYEWTDEATVKDMRKHSEYVEVVEQEEKPAPKKTAKDDK